MPQFRRATNGHKVLPQEVRSQFISGAPRADRSLPRCDSSSQSSAWLDHGNCFCSDSSISWVVPQNVFNGLFIDRFEWRRFVLIGCTGIIVCLSCEAAVTTPFVENPAHFHSFVGLGFEVVLIFVHVCFYSSCLDAVNISCTQ